MSEMPKRRVFVIHGGDAFATYEDYIAALKLMTVDLERGARKGWKGTLQESLGDEYEVILPRMPNANNAKYEEWKIWFEKYVPSMRDGVILVGHSLGGIFLAKYLSENALPVKIAATFLVAAPYELDPDGRIVEFALPESLSLLASQGGKIFLYQSKDDPVVDFVESEKYHAALPEATVVLFDDRGHFDQEQLPEIVRDIRSL